VDYDTTAIPAGYDRGRRLSADTLAQWMDEVARHLSLRPRSILDLGCGTGRFSDPLAVRFTAPVAAVDPSAKMLAEAAAKPMRGAVHLVRAAGEAIPLAGDTIDLVFTSMAYHHFRDAARVARECRRVCRQNAVVFVRTGTRDRVDEYAFVPFIPASRPLIVERLPPVEQIAHTFASAGFAVVFTGTVVQRLASTYQEYAEKLAAGADSVLASLEPGELESGIEAIRRHAARVDPAPVTEPIDILVFRAA
jgi:ubiquinone/menaquinone biosynthesis C-methylase UbiE